MTGTTRRHKMDRIARAAIRARYPAKDCRCARHVGGDGMAMDAKADVSGGLPRSSARGAVSFERPIAARFQRGGCDHVETDDGSEFSGSGSRSRRRGCVSPCREDVRVGRLGRATEAVGAGNGPAMRKTRNMENTFERTTRLRAAQAGAEPWLWSFKRPAAESHVTRRLQLPAQKAFI